MEPGLIEVTTLRHNPGIDPHLHMWGWEIMLYLFLGGLVAGILILQPAAELRDGERSKTLGGMAAPFLGLAMIQLGLLALLKDLHYPLHVYRFFMAWRPTSPMSWGSWLLMGIMPIMLLTGLGGVTDDWRRWLPRNALLGALFRFADQYRRPLLWASIVGGVGLGTYTGLLLGTLPARVTWNTALLGPLFLTSGVSTGAAFLLLSDLGARKQEFLVRADTVAILVELAILALILVVFAGGDAHARSAVAPLLGGDWTPAFWGLVVATGLVVPLLMNLAEITRHLPMTRVAPILVLVGGFALRWILVSVGQETSMLHVAGLLP